MTTDKMPALPEPVMRDDTDSLLNDILSRWHHWASQNSHTVGFPTIDATCRLYRASRQYDDANGALDQDVENVIMAGVDACIDRIDQPYRTAIWVNARNLCTGCAVWRSPRLPDDELAVAFMVLDARALLLQIMVQRGIV